MAEVIYIQWNSTWEWRLIHVMKDLSVNGSPRDDPEAWRIVSNKILYGMFGPERCRKKWFQLMDKFVYNSSALLYRVFQYPRTKRVPGVRNGPRNACAKFQIFIRISFRMSQFATANQSAPLHTHRCKASVTPHAVQRPHSVGSKYTYSGQPRVRAIDCRLFFHSRFLTCISALLNG